MSGRRRHPISRISHDRPIAIRVRLETSNTHLVSRRALGSTLDVARADELEQEQRHLDVTYATFDALVRRLSAQRSFGVDEFADEALELMRRERLRVYVEASGPLYFGRIDLADGRTLCIGRHAVADQDNRLSAVRKSREYQRTVTRCWPRLTADALLSGLFKNPARLRAVARRPAQRRGDRGVAGAAPAG